MGQVAKSEIERVDICIARHLHQKKTIEVEELNLMLSTHTLACDGLYATYYRSIA